MKVLIPVIHYHPVIGGLETWTREISERLAKRDDVFVVTGKIKGEPKKEEKKQVRLARTSLFSLRNLSHSSWLYILTAIPFIFLKSLRVIKKEKINLMHCQGFLSSFVGFLISKLARIPYITTVQRLETKSWLKTIVYRNAKACIAASLAIQSYFEKIGCKTIKVIPNGIDMSKFDNLNRDAIRMSLGLDNDEFIIITVARLEKVKGLEYLIKAAHILCFTFHVSGFKLLIIGDGSERKNLEHLADNLGLSKQVRFVGQMTNQQIPKHLTTADCFVLPSIKEGFGIAILEAMAAELPVVATNIGGILDLIENGKSGILVEPQDPMAITQAIIRIYSEPDTASFLSRNARKNAEKYDWDNISQRVSNLYIQSL